MFLSEKLAISFGSIAKKSLKLDDDKEKIVVYGAINLIQTLLNIFCVIFFGFIFGAVYEALIFSFVAAILRKYSGGGHASSPNRCLIIGTIFTIIFAVLIKRVLYKLNVYMIIFCVIIFIFISLFIVYKKAPVDSIKKPIRPELRRKFKIKSIRFIVVMCIIIISFLALNLVRSNRIFIETIEAISLALLWQSISLTKGGIFFLSCMDRILKCLMGGGEVNE